MSKGLQRSLSFSLSLSLSLQTHAWVRHRRALSHAPRLMCAHTHTHACAPTGGTGPRLQNLQTLDLSANQIADFEQDTLSGLMSLERLYLSSNRIAGFANGTFSGLLNLDTLELANNPGAPFACPPVSYRSSGCEMNRLQTCGWSGDCVFWLDGRTLMLSRTGECETSCSYLWLDDEGITGFAPGTWSGMSNLRYLSLSNNNIAGFAPGTLSGLTALKNLELRGNPGTPFACPSSLRSSSGCELDRIEDCGGCTFWLGTLSEKSVLWPVTEHVDCIHRFRAMIL